MLPACELCPYGSPTALDTSEFVCPDPNGYFGAESRITFWHCQDNKPTSKKCPAVGGVQLRYDIESIRCSLPEQVDRDCPLEDGPAKGSSPCLCSMEGGCPPWPCPARGQDGTIPQRWGSGTGIGGWKNPPVRKNPHFASAVAHARGAVLAKIKPPPAPLPLHGSVGRPSATQMQAKRCDCTHPPILGRCVPSEALHPSWNGHGAHTGCNTDITDSHERCESSRHSNPPPSDGCEIF